MFDDKTLLITGGTGSFGNAVLRRFLDSGLREIRIFSRDEKKQDDMRKRYNSAGLKFYLVAVRDERSVRPAMRGVAYVAIGRSSCWGSVCSSVKISVVACNIK